MPESGLDDRARAVTEPSETGGTDPIGADDGGGRDAEGSHPPGDDLPGASTSTGNARETSGPSTGDDAADPGSDADRTNHGHAPASDGQEAPADGVVTGAAHEDPAAAPVDTAPAPVDTAAAPVTARRSSRWGLMALAALAALFLLYVLDITVSSGAVPRGTTVAGVDVAGLSPQQAEERLRAQLAPRLADPLVVRLDEASVPLDPQVLGLQVDYAATVERAVRQPWSPWTRLRTLFGAREVPPVIDGDRTRVGAALDQARPALDRPVVEAAVRVGDGAVQVTRPRPGRRVDRDPSITRVIAEGVDGEPINLAGVSVPTQVTAEGLDEVVRSVAEPAVSGPVELRGAGAAVGLTVTDIGTVLRFAPDGRGGMTSEVDVEALRSIAAPTLAPTEATARDAGVRFVAERPEVTPSEEGRAVDYQRAAADLYAALRRPRGAGTPGAVAEVAVPYRPVPARVRTDQVASLASATVIGEFRTRGFKPDSGQNIRRVAEQVDGAVVLPGEVFSLNGYTGPRDAAQGYVEAGVIEDGRPARAVGGGISQFATTLYNAAYFAGMDDVEHKEHSYYINRYPPAREATVFEGVIDLKFRNTTDGPIVIHTVWTPSSINVALFGQRRFEVTSTPGPRTDTTPFGTETVPGGAPCQESDGVAGFTTTDTRTIRDLRTGAVRTERRTVRYNPEPEIRCG